MDAKIVLTLVLLPLVLSLRCEKKYHAWKPYAGKDVHDIFLAAADPAGVHKYIAKIIVPDKTSYTVPAEILYDHVPFSWAQGPSMRATEFIEVMTSGNPKRLHWSSVNESCGVHCILNCHCLVEGGGYFVNQKFYPFYIGRAFRDNKYYVGRVPLLEGHRGSVMHSMEGWSPISFNDDFEVLTYKGVKDD